MFNLDTLNKDFYANFVSYTSIKDISSIVRLNKATLTLMPIVKQELEYRVNVMVKAFMSHLAVNRLDADLTCIRNIHPSRWEWEYDVYFAEDLTFCMTPTINSLKEIKSYIGNWMLNKIFIKNPPSLSMLKEDLKRLYVECVEKKVDDKLIQDSAEGMMLIDYKEASGISSTSESDVESMEVDASHESSVERRLQNICRLWLYANTPEEKNEHFLHIIFKARKFNISLDRVLEILIDASKTLPNAEQNSILIAAFFQTLLAFGELDFVKRHLYKQEQQVVSVFFRNSICKFPHLVKNLLLNFSQHESVPPELIKQGIFLLMKSHLRKREFDAVLDLARYDMANFLSKHMREAFVGTCFSKIEIMLFGYRLFLMYPHVREEEINVLELQECVREAIEAHGFRSVAEAFPLESRLSFVQFSKKEIKQMQSVYESRYNISNLLPSNSWETF